MGVVFVDGVIVSQLFCLFSIFQVSDMISTTYTAFIFHKLSSKCVYTTKIISY